MLRCAPDEELMKIFIFPLACAKAECFPPSHNPKLKDADEYKTFINFSARDHYYSKQDQSQPWNGSYDNNSWGAYGN